MLIKGLIWVVREKKKGDTYISSFNIIRIYKFKEKIKVDNLLPLNIIKFATIFVLQLVLEKTPEIQI